MGGGRSIDNAGRARASVGTVLGNNRLSAVDVDFVKIHQSLRMTPAMAAGVTDRLWEIEDLVGLLVFRQ